MKSVKNAFFILLLFLIKTLPASEMETPLINAIKNNQPIEEIMSLLKENANVEERDAAGRTPLMWAAVSEEKIGIVALLLDNNANVESKSNVGNTPGDFAVLGGQAIYNLLLNNNRLIPADNHSSNFRKNAENNDTQQIDFLTNSINNQEVSNLEEAAKMAVSNFLLGAQILRDSNRPAFDAFYNAWFPKLKEVSDTIKQVNTNS